MVSAIDGQSLYTLPWDNLKIGLPRFLSEELASACLKIGSPVSKPPAADEDKDCCANHQQTNAQNDTPTKRILL